MMNSSVRPVCGLWYNPRHEEDVVEEYAAWQMNETNNSELLDILDY